MKILIKDLLEHKEEIIGKRINIVRQGGKYHYDYQDRKVFRVITDIKTHFEKDNKTKENIKWVTWFWKTQPITAEENLNGLYGSIDHGFAGMGLGSGLLDSSYLDIN